MRRALPPAVLAAAILAVWHPVLGQPLRPWDHHAILLLADAPQFREGLAARLLHYALDDAAAGAVYFKALAMPLVYAAGAATRDPLVHHLLALACHLAACLALFRLASELGGSRATAFLLAAIFSCFTGATETAGIPFYLYMTSATALAGGACLALLRGRGGLAAHLFLLATLLYDAFLPLAVLTPLLWKRWKAAAGVALALGAVYVSCRQGAAAGSGSPVAQAFREAVPASGWAAATLAADLAFLGGAMPGIERSGSMLNWEYASLVRPSAWALLLPAALCLLGALRRSPRSSREAGLLLAAGLSCAWMISLGRPGGHAVFTARYHYLTGFFVLATLAAWLKGAARGPAIAALAACALLQANNTRWLIGVVARDNAPVFGFQESLRRQTPGSVFAPFSTAAVETPDWMGWPLEDVAFDLLNRDGNPLTRHAGRARLLLRQDGSVSPNPHLGQAGGGDFLFRFLLRGDAPPGRHEMFGSAPGEPRVVLEGNALSFHRWTFALPPAKDPQGRWITLERRGDEVLLEVDGERTGRAKGECPPWTSDNLALLGKDWERLATARRVYHTFMRIGAGTPPPATATP